jgi:hypothetical protein
MGIAPANVPALNRLRAWSLRLTGGLRSGTQIDISPGHFSNRSDPFARKGLEKPGLPAGAGGVPGGAAAKEVRS